MTSTPWKTKDWFTSPWNFAPEVRQKLAIPGEIKIHDVSLRDGEQQSGLIFNKDQKVAIAEQLAEVGVHRIEAGMPAVSPHDEAAIREIVKRDLGPEIFAFCRCAIEDVKRAADCGVTGVVVEIPSSEHMVKNAYNWSMEKAMELSISSTAYAKELGLYTVFFPIDASRADIDWFLEMIQTVERDGHMDALAMVDTMGGLAPSAIPYLIKKVKEKIDKPIEAHFHDDFGMGSANTVVALMHGAEVAHTTISAIGERAGNTAYEDVALTLLTMYGVDLGLDYSKIYETSVMIQKVSGYKIPQNRGIIGSDIFNIESGIIADWYANAHEEHPLELSPYLAGLTGHPDWNVVIGKNSGAPTVQIYCDLLGYTCETKEQTMKIVSLIKEKAFEKSGLLTIDEFKEIASKVLD
jgi:isopropylmalate/homocitrate/citramalate synthase